MKMSAAAGGEEEVVKCFLHMMQVMGTVSVSE
jgi:hypothetical protein